MCFECWKQHGSPVIDDEDGRKARQVIDSVFSFSRRGGSLQYVLRDWELNDESLREARAELDYLRQHRDASQIEAETRCLEFLEQLSFQKRVAALAAHEEFY